MFRSRADLQGSSYIEEARFTFCGRKSSLKTNSSDTRFKNNALLYSTISWPRDLDLFIVQHFLPFLDLDLGGPI